MGKRGFYVVSEKDADYVIYGTVTKNEMRNNEAYQLDINPKYTHFMAPNACGVFYAFQSLKQLFIKMENRFTNQLLRLWINPALYGAVCNWMHPVTFSQNHL